MTIRIGELLVARQILRPEDLERALRRQLTTQRRLASTCLELGLADEEILAKALAYQTGVPFVVLSQSIIAGPALKQLPPNLAKILPALPVELTDGEIVVAIADPYDISMTGELALATGRHLIEHGALQGPLIKSIELAYRSPEQGFVGADAKTNTVGLTIVTGRNEFAPTLEIARLKPKEDDLSRALPVNFADVINNQLDQDDQPEQTTILVVEDDEAIRKMLVTYLSKEGYLVTQASDGREAVKHLQTHLPHAILLDAMLPGIHGFEICRMLKQAQATRDIPVIMVSAVYRGKKTSEDIRIQHGANAHLEKPLRLAKLEVVLNNCLAGRQAPPSRPLLARRLSEQLLLVNQTLARKEPEVAIKHYRNALSIAPFLPTLHYRVAKLYLQVGKRYQAIEHLLWTIRLQPNQSARFLLAETYEKTGFLQKAKEAWQDFSDHCSDEKKRTKVQQHIDQIANWSQTSERSGWFTQQDDEI